MSWWNPGKFSPKCPIAESRLGTGDCSRGCRAGRGVPGPSGEPVAAGSSRCRGEGCRGRARALPAGWSGLESRTATAAKGGTGRAMMLTRPAGSPAPPEWRAAAVAAAPWGTTQSPCGSLRRVPAGSGVATAGNPQRNAGRNGAGSTSLTRCNQSGKRRAAPPDCRHTAPSPAGNGIRLVEGACAIDLLDWRTGGPVTSSWWTSSGRRVGARRGGRNGSDARAGGSNPCCGGCCRPSCSARPTAAAGAIPHAG